MPDRDWWLDFFDLCYAECALLPADEAERAEVARNARGAARLLGLEPGMRCFDQCCGLGRMSHALGRLGIETVGVDLVPDYVREAESIAAKEGLPCRFERGDAFVHVVAPPCDAGLNWFSSFGYGEDDARSARMVASMRRSLRDGARFLLEIIATPWLLRNRQRAFFTRRVGRSGEEVTILHEPRFDWRRGLVHDDWTFIRADGQRHRRPMSMRIFMPHELCALLEAGGFEILDLLADVDGAPFDEDARRLLLVARAAPGRSPR